MAGTSELIYSYTVAGSDKATIDTGVDTADAGSGDWTGGDVLEVFFIARQDDAAAIVFPLLTVNNDGSAIYDRDFDGANNATQQASSSNAATSWNPTAHGSGGSASYPGVIRLTIPHYAGTTFWKVGELTQAAPDATAGNQSVGTWSVGWRSTSAITRLKWDAGGSQKFKVGTRLLIYKRVSSSGDKKISNLTDGGALLSTDYLVVARAGANRKIAGSGIPGLELDYQTRTSNFAVSATTAASATTVVTGTSLSYDGSTRVCIEAIVPRSDYSSSGIGGLQLNLWDGSTDLGSIAQIGSDGGYLVGNMSSSVFLTPSNASHQYLLKAWMNGTSPSANLYASSAFPVALRITRA